ncbi:MAG: hypothetical protein IPJ14_11715 [Kineosporiaceae bacterium]|nr:hypothetical protein [Kineosporiaceae bacterium]
MTQRFLDEVDPPLSELTLDSNHLELAQSSALQQGAENLLTKAIDALAEDDAARADRLVRRALGLPFDDYEECTPAWWQAYMLLFLLITDELEDGPDDEAWLDAALQVEAQATGAGRDAVRLALAVIEQDFGLDRAAARRIRERIGTTKPLPSWQDLLPEAPDDATAAILQVLTTFNAYDDALDLPADA